jgi:RHS repeat-associated protein
MLNRMVTNSTGGVYTEMGHFPFGESWYNTTGEKLNFTTYEYDAESGNHYAMARYHISRLGRLSSPDPIAGSTANPQSLNRYSYSINDPANVTDPSGALVGCPSTADAQPKDKSSQASTKSGGGPSESDNSDAGTDETENRDGSRPAPAKRMWEPQRPLRRWRRRLLQ